MDKPFNTHSEKIEAYILSKEEKWQSLLFELRDFILHSHDEMQEFYKYRIPFFGLKKNICYLTLRADQICIEIGIVSGAKLEMKHPEIAPYFEHNELKSVRHFKVYLNTWNNERMESLNQILILAIDHSISS